jgi:membrane-bound serine protease (ClpP class)
VSHGVLTIGGIIAILLGSMMLVNTPEFPLRIAWSVIVPVVALTAGIFVFAVSAGVRAQMQRPTTGVAGLLHETGVAQTPIDPEGQVLVRGELWAAVADAPGIPAGERVRVVGVEGLRLRVERASGQPA